VQAKLLRAIEARAIERVGGRRPIAVDLRLISATNEDLEARVAQGAFREDLFYRINTIPLRVPPLRERLDDLPVLSAHFLEKLGARHRRPGRRLAPAVLERLREHPWRGNVRELEHVIEMLVLFSDREEIGEEDLPRVLRSRARPPSGPPRDGLPFAKAVEDFERSLLSEAIAQAGGVKAEAARRLGLDGNQIKYLCRKYGL
jgi:DNA-binding NtrC family response regulator